MAVLMVVQECSGYTSSNVHNKKTALYLPTKSFTNHHNKHKYITPIEHVFCLWCFWKEGWSFCQIVINPGCFQFQIVIKHEFDGSAIRRYWVIIWVAIFVGLLIALSFFYCHGNSFRANVLNQHFSLVHIGHKL